MRRHINGRRQILRAVTACAMVWILAVSMAIPVSAATARATTMRLEKTEGTVTLKTQNGTARTISNGMRLYNGNTLATATSGYAYISLDSTKAVKLDQNSSATLRQNGKQLELLVKRGKLFFNVSQPLTEKENMNVRTSTMVTGIRGTCGIVEYVNVNRSKLYLLEGKVTLGSGENKTTVYGGQTATVVLQPKKESDGTDKPGDTSQTGAKMEQKVMVDTLTEEEIPTVALQEIVSDPILQEKIEQTTDLKIEKIEEVYEEFQKEEAERNDQEQTEQDSDKPTETEPEKETEQEQTTTSGGGSYVPSTPATPAADPSTLSGTVTLEQLNTAFASYNAVTLAGTLTMNSTETVSETVSIPAGKSLTVSGSIEGNGVISLGAGSALTNSGTIRATSISDAATTDDYHPYAGVLRLMSYRLREASATASVTNNGRIELIGDYLSGATYQCGTQAVLIIPEETASVLTDSGIWLMTTSVSTSVYASELNQRVADYLCECTQSGAATADFRQDATVTSNVTLKSATDQNTLQLVLDGDSFINVQSGTLTLDSSIKVNSSSADAVIALAGGNLAITGTSKSGGAYIINEGSGYGVSVSNGSKITWSNPDFMIQAQNGLDKTIQGVTANSDNYTVTLPANVTVTGVLQCDGNTLFVLSPEFTSDTVLLPLLQAALNGYDTVTLGAEASVSMHDGDTLTIPSGKTLNIGCQVTENTSGGETYYSGGFNMTEKSVLAVQPGAKVNVSGWVQGNGTLTVGSGATVEVGTAGKIEAAEISLDGASLTNGNIIDGGNLTSTGGSTITNNALIKLSGAYTLSSSSVDKYTTSDDGALISGSESTALASGGQFMFTMDATDGTNNTQQYYYASYLNERVQNYVQAFIDDANKNQKTYTCTFKNNVIVKNGSEITLTGFNADVGTCKLQVEGALTLTDIKAITGSGINVIYLTGAGTLTLDGSSEGYIASTSEADTHYAIAVSDEILKSTERVKWVNQSLRIQATTPGNNSEFIIQGFSTGGSSQSDSYLSHPGYSLGTSGGILYLEA